MFIDIAPIVEDNRSYVIKQMLETNRLTIFLDEQIMFEDNTFFYSIYAVVLNKALNSLHFLYTYGTNKDELNCHSWFAVNDFPLLVENEVLKKVSETFG